MDSLEIKPQSGLFFWAQKCRATMDAQYRLDSHYQWCPIPSASNTGETAITEHAHYRCASNTERVHYPTRPPTIRAGRRPGSPEVESVKANGLV